MADSVLANSSPARLENWLAQSQLARGNAAVQMIKEVLSAPQTYVFAELLEVQGVIDLEKDPQTLPWLQLLRIFSYGTFQDYKDNANTLPSLGDRELTKLKHLSIVSLSEQSRIIDYDLLLNYLEVQNVRELEDLIIDAIYKDVIKGKLDQKKKQLEIEYAMGRDLHPGQMEQMLNVMNQWSKTSDDILCMIDAKIRYVHEQTERNRVEKEEHEQKTEMLKKQMKFGKLMETDFDHRLSSKDQSHSPEYAEESARSSRLSKRDLPVSSSSARIGGAAKRFMMGAGRR